VCVGGVECAGGGVGVSKRVWEGGGGGGREVGWGGGGGGGAAMRWAHRAWHRYEIESLVG